MTAIKHLSNKLNWFAPVSAAPLAIYRIGFGLLMLFSTIRFIAKGWVYAQYIQPKFHFSYYGFEWLPYPSDSMIYALFGLMIIGSVSICLGLFYRFGSLLFFISFTYVELLDKANYLNHYYFVSLIALLLVFIPANRYFSLDAKFGFTKHSNQCAKWNIAILQFQIAVVYIFAGIAKLNTDWLIEGQPLKYWLHTAHHYAYIGDLLKQDWLAYFFAWFACAYDLFIVLFLLNKRSRKVAYLFVLIFHFTTWLLFPIGVFPWVMIMATTIFFSAEIHEKIIQTIRIISGQSKLLAQEKRLSRIPKAITASLLAIYISIQLLLPFRYMLYDGKLFWTEQGFRFSWRVMLIEKAGYATFYVKDPEKGHQLEVNNKDYLTPNQEKMMSTQADMILQYAHFLEEEYRDTTVNRFGIDMQFNAPEVHAEVFVTLNSRPHQLFVDPKHNLATIDFDLTEKTWLEDYKQ